MLIAYVSGHGFGHATRLCEVLRAVRARASTLPITVVGAVPEWLVRRNVPGPVAFRAVACDVGLAQRDALMIDEPGTAERCREFDATWDARLEVEASFLRSSGARVVLGDIPALAFAAAARAGISSLALGNFSWDWIYRHLAERQPTRQSVLQASAERAARAYADATLLLELPFAGLLSPFARRERVGLVARRPRIGRGEARRRLGLDARPAILVSFGGVGLPGLTRRILGSDRSLQFVLPDEVEITRLDALGLYYPDVVGAVDVVVTKPGYGIVSDAIGAGTRLVYTDRGDFPEYPIMVREMPDWLACVHVENGDLRLGRIAEPIHRVLAQPMPPPRDLGGAARAAARVLDALGS
jgi:L-arabinokinase